MDQLLETVALIVGVAVLSAVADRLRVLPPILLVVAGVALSYVPGVPAYDLDPEIVLVFFLPPLVYAAAIGTSLPTFKQNLRPIGLLAVGLVLFSTVVVGLVAHAVVPGLPLAAAFALGAVVAPPDAVAATSIARRVGMPRRLVAVIEGEGLVNDATALVALRVTVAAAVSGGFSWVQAGGQFVLAVVGGVAVGALVAVAVSMLRRHTEDVTLDNTRSLLTPFLAYLPAEQLHVSGIIAVVVAGIYLGHRAPIAQSAGSRLQQQVLWRTIEFLLQGTVFLLIGLQLRHIVDRLSQPAGTVAAASVAVVVAALVARPVWVFPVTYLTRLVPRVRERDPMPPWQYPAALSWCGMRGVVSLAAVLSLPRTVDSGAPFPQRDLLVFLTFVVIAVTLIGQGLTLPTVIRRLGLRPPDPQEDTLQEAATQHRAVQAALARLDELVREDPPPDGVADELRRHAENRRLFAWEQLGGDPGVGSDGSSRDRRETPSAAYRRLRQEMLNAERRIFVQARDDGTIDESVLRRVQRDLDLEETMLRRE